MTIIEGMFFGCPVIAPNYGGPKDIIVHNYNGFLLDNITSDEILNYLNMVEVNYMELSSNALQTADNYSFENYRTHIKRIFLCRADSQKS